MFTGDIAKKVAGVYDNIIQQAPNLNTVGTLTTGIWNASTVGIAYGGTNATSFGTSHGTVVYDGTRLVNYAGPQISTSGLATNTSQPFFQVYLSSNQLNVTGDNTVFTIPFDTVVTDQNSNFTTGVAAHFTAPVTAQYFFSIGVEVYGITGANTSGLIQITRSDGTFWTGGLFNWGNLANSGGACIPTASFCLGMSATQTMKVQIQISGSGTKNCNVAGGTSTQYLTYFSGYLIC